ncbi:proline-rich protein PRCC [Pieris napi]|uniref:proline-rich protein PRCC n=1 Tax=Pieris napi TaxID=78633 RepID=UPI001FB86E6B|nr:proline-rich protein PRCC [Pieris napi]XP_047519848.1 proline-rich protein PRCC [Pieris napi]
MALVAYDNSDSSDYDEPECTGETSKLQAILPDLPLANGTEVRNEKNLFNLLPKPTKQKITLKEDDDDILLKKEIISEVKPKSRITVPSLGDFKDIEDTVPSAKRKVSKEKKSGLLSILPQPKNSTKVSTKMLIPQSVSNKPPATVKKKDCAPSIFKKNKVETKSAVKTDFSDESDTDDFQNDFFSINKPVEVIPENVPFDIDVKVEQSQKEPRSLESYFKKDDHVTLEPDYQGIEPQLVQEESEYTSNQSDVIPVDPTSSGDVLDEEAILKLCGTRGKRKREEIQIVDVNQQEVLKDAREMLLKGLMDDTTKRQSHSKKKGNEPTSQQKRKHQITYLAHKAKANEAELQNQWANNRMTKRQTQSKYGF